MNLIDKSISYRHETQEVLLAGATAQVYATPSSCLKNSTVAAFPIFGKAVAHRKRARTIEREVIARGVFTSVADLARLIQWKYSDPLRRVRTNEFTATCH